MDIGSGDGKGPYRLARKDPDRLFLATDLNADALRETAWRAARRESRGGARNLLCIAASAGELASELPGVADRLSILLPWGELLTAVAEPDPSLLKALATLAQPGAAIEIVLSHDPGRDPRVLALPPCYELDAAAVRDRLKAAYDGSGLELLEVETLDQRALVDYPTTWAKRLAHGRPRRIWRIRATRS